MIMARGTPRFGRTMAPLARHRSSIVYRLIVAGMMLVVVGPDRLRAHRLDEYLQVAQISVEPDVITIDLYLTPGVQVASAIISTIDASDDGVIAAGEGAAYAREVLQSVGLAVDGQPRAILFVASDYPAIEELRGGLGSVHVRGTAGRPPADGASHVITFENRFDPSRSVYLANAMLPRDPTVAIRGQVRTSSQARLDVAYDIALSGTKRRLDSRRLVSAVGGLGVTGGLVWLHRRRSSTHVPVPDDVRK
jgi:hypothetical protein